MYVTCKKQIRKFKKNYLNGRIVIAQQRMDAQQTDQTEVAQHLVGRVLAELAGHRVRITSGSGHLQLLLDVRHIDQRMQHIQHTQNVPHRRINGVQLHQLLLRLIGQSSAILRIALVLIDELIDQLPQPDVGQLQIDAGRRRYDRIEELAIIEIRHHALLDLRSARNASVNVPEVQLLVQHLEQGVQLEQFLDIIHVRPGVLVVVLLAQLRPDVLVQILDLVDVLLLDLVAEVADEVQHDARHNRSTLVLHVAMRITGVTLIVIVIL